MTTVVSLSLVLWIAVRAVRCRGPAAHVPVHPEQPRRRRREAVEPVTARSRAASSRLNGEAGFQPDVLRGGWHVLMPFQYRLHKCRW